MLCIIVCVSIFGLPAADILQREDHIRKEVMRNGNYRSEQVRYHRHHRNRLQPLYETLFEEETKPNLEGFDKGQVTELGAVNVMTGIYTGRSPKDKFIVMDEDVYKRQRFPLRVLRHPEGH